MQAHGHENMTHQIVTHQIVAYAPRTKTGCPGPMPPKAGPLKLAQSPPSALKAEALWVAVSPSLGVFDRPLLRQLAYRATLAQWQYEQDMDESCAIEQAVALLGDYLQGRDRQGLPPIHLVGHGLGGVVALLCARRHAKLVRSLTLLAVAEQPAVTWHAHYYVQRHLLPYSQTRLLAQMAGSLFRPGCPCPAPRLVQALQRDLEQAPLLHSACHLESLPQGGVALPLMVCGAEDDAVVHPAALQAWSRWLKLGDRPLLFPQGGHFFHYTQAAPLARKIHSFWKSQSIPEARMLSDGEDVAPA